ncbi:MAG: adenylate/guanylate cyclase domain-containing protein, partial [Saprospiraceae bacterium]
MKNKNVRRLAAVMFTDIVGYTALMQKDERAAVKVRDYHRKVFDQQHKLYQGEILQYFGDGTLSIF